MMSATRIVQDIESSVGREIFCSDWLLITQERIDTFAAATGDAQWIHTDPERAKRESPYGTTIAHGFLTLSLLSHFIEGAIRISGMKLSVNYGLNRVRFPAPVKAGSRIRARFAVASTREIPDGEEVVLSATIECDQQTKPVCVADWIVRFYGETEIADKRNS